MSGSFKKAGTGAGAVKASLSPKPPKIGSPLRAKLPSGKTGVIQFTRTLLVAPFTKSNIAGATASGVNFLDYTPVTGDDAYVLGADVTSTASTKGGTVVDPSVVPPTPPALVASNAIGSFAIGSMAI